MPGPGRLAHGRVQPPVPPAYAGHPRGGYRFPQHGLHQGEFDVLAREPNPDDDRRGVMVSLTPKGLRAGGKP